MSEIENGYEGQVERVSAYIVAWANSKGGATKSTQTFQTSTRLAALGFTVLVVDGDDQASSAKSIAKYKAKGFDPDGRLQVIEAFGADLAQVVEDNRYSYDYIIIDTGAKVTPALQAAFAVVDQVVIPHQPCRMDAEALDKMYGPLAEALEGAEFPIHLVVTRDDLISNEGALIAADLAHALPTLPVEVMQERICNRKAVRRSMDEAIPVWNLRDKHGVKRDQREKAIAEYDAQMLVLFPEIANRVVGPETL